MKRTSFKLAVSLILTLPMMACETETMEAVKSDLVPATLVDMTGLDGCGWVFELQDETKLEFIMPIWCGTPPLPETNYENPFVDFEFEDGKQVRIAYKELEDMSSICMVGKIVEITKIEEPLD